MSVLQEPDVCLSFYERKPQDLGWLCLNGRRSAVDRRQWMVRRRRLGGNRWHLPVRERSVEIRGVL